MPRLFVLSLVLVACAVAPPPAPAPAPTVLPSATRDFDRDGFPDPRDRCPREPGPEPLGCPELDEDNDTYTTSFDRCPQQSGGPPDGCPPPDADADGVPDEHDQCADKLETRNGFDDADGCPDKLPKDLARITGRIKGVDFVGATATLKKSAHRVLDRALAVLKRHPAVRIEVSAHLDPSFYPLDGRDPAKDRADAVKNYLVDHGLDPARVEVRGAGLDEPVASNRTPEGRARNRRIEFTILVQ